MELAEEVAENDQYGENDTQPLNSAGEEEDNYFEEDYRSERRYKKSFSDHDEKYNVDEEQDGDVNSDYNNKHVKRRRSGGDHSDGDSDHRHHSRHRSVDQDRDRGNHRRRHHRSRKKDRERSRHSRRNNNSRSSQELEAELEDGELEDGELDDDDNNDYQENITPTKLSPPKLDRKESGEKSSPKKYPPGQTENHTEEEVDYPENAVESEGEEEGNIEERTRPQKDDHDSKRRRKEKRDKDKRRKQQKEEKKKKKRREYHDFDKVEEDYDQVWGTGIDKHSNHPPNSRGSRGSYERSPPGPYEDQFEDQGQYERTYNSPPVHYDSPYDSPPGPYDSPSYDEDSEGEMYEQGNHLKPRRTMMSMVEGDYVDANVVIDEGENIYKHQNMSNKKMKQIKQMKRKMDRQQQGDQPPKKKPLLLTPMNERPICKFFKEGKCSKGNDCPFNHDYRPPKKMDLCKFYLNSQCSKGDNCIFMHGEFPCKFFHTGANCYSGDNCKFSHDPLTDETAPLVDKFFQDFSNRDEEAYGDGQRMGPPRPSLLGSPPRHMAEQQSERVKKIPSIFDIKVYPPGQSPKKPPLNDGPPNVHPPQMCGPPSRPSGFYTDMNQPPPMQGPPMPHQQGPQMPGPNQQGPPMSGPHQQGPPMSGPHQQGPPMPRPHQQGPPMAGPRSHGPPMSNPHMQGPGMPPMQGPPMPGPRMQGPPMQTPPVSSAAMNPAVALVGALLRQAAPQVLRQNTGPPGPQNMRPPGPQNMGPPGSQNMAPPGPMQNMPSQFQGPNQTGPFNSPQGIYGSSNDKITSPPHEQNPVSTNQLMESKDGEDPSDNGLDMKTEDNGRNTNDLEKTEQSEPEAEKAGTEEVPTEDESNEKKLSTLGLNLDSLTHLPAKQRELFLRIQNQQGDGLKDTQTDEEDKVEKVQDEKLDDDNWYSSDEEDVPTTKPKLTDILKNLSQKPTPESPQTPGPTNYSQSSALDIMQMINSIRKANSTSVGTPDIPANSNPPTFPRDTAAHVTSKAPVTMPDPVIINSSEGDIPYKLRPITVDKSQQTKPPQGLDVNNVQFKNDPRMKKFIVYLESQAQKVVKPVKPIGSQGTDTVEGKLDPRTGQPVDRRIDPRVKSRLDAAVEGARPVDPRLQGPDSQVTHSNIPPQLQRPPSNPLLPTINVGMNPRPDSGTQKPLDPRMSRQMSRDGNASGGLPQRPVDPRMGPQDPRMGPQDPRMGPQDPRMGPQDPRMGPLSQDPRVGPQDPRMGPQDSRMGPQDPRMGPQDSRMGPQDPRMGPQDPRMGPQDPRMGPQDPRVGPQDPRGGVKDPRANSDPRRFQNDPRSTTDMEPQRQIDPRSLQRQGSVGADPRKPPALDPRRPPPGDMSSVQSSSDLENKKTEELDTPKPKLDYRNDPRFKRKPASESVGHKRYTGQRKSSMDYSSPLGLDSEDKGTYNSYQRPDSAKHKTESRPLVKGKLDPRTNKPDGSSPNVDSSPLPPPPPDGNIGMPVALEIPPFVTPNALEPQMKDFFKTMDPTASPFC